MPTLTVGQIDAINIFVRDYGAANLMIESRKNRLSWTIGFRYWQGPHYRIEACFRLPVDTSLTDIVEYHNLIEAHLNACIDDPSVALTVHNIRYDKRPTYSDHYLKDRSDGT